jgi:hypothetical protein
VTLATATPLACPVSVPWQTANGTAVAGQDFTPPANGLVTFPTGGANGAAQAVAVPIVNDVVYEPAETFSLVLGTPVGALAGAVSSHTVTIQDNESVPVVSIGNATVSESGGSAVFTVSVSPASAQTITVPYSTVPDTATAGADYTPVPAGSAIQLAPYQLSGTVSVAVVPDGLVEPTETFTVQLGTPTNAQLGDGAGVGQILDASSIIDLTLPGRYFADATGGPGGRRLHHHRQPEQRLAARRADLRQSEWRLGAAHLHARSEEPHGVASGRRARRGRPGRGVGGLAVGRPELPRGGLPRRVLGHELGRRALDRGRDAGLGLVPARGGLGRARGVDHRLQPRLRLTAR